MSELAQHLYQQGADKVHVLSKTGGKTPSDAVEAGWDTDAAMDWARAHKELETQKRNGELTKDPTPHHDTPPVPEWMEEIPAPAEWLTDQPPPPEEELPPLPEARPYIKQEYYSTGGSELPFPRDPANLFEDFCHVPPLERGMLPQVIEDYVFDRAAVMEGDPSFMALSAIVACCAVIDNRIKLKVWDEWYESARLWGCCVGEPSTKKTPLSNNVIHAVGELIKKIDKEDRQIQKRNKIAERIYQGRLKVFEDAHIKGSAAGMMPEEPTLEEQKQIMIVNFTREAVEETLRHQSRGLFIKADELGGWIGSFDQYRAGGAGPDRALWLQGFDGGPMPVKRIGRGDFVIPSWSFSILGGIQPSKMRELAPSLGDDGLLQRFLVVSSNVEAGEGCKGAVNAEFGDRWIRLIDQLYHTTPGSIIEMSAEARAVRAEATAVIKQLITHKTISTAFCTHLGKWFGITARMMLCYHCIECAMQHAHPSSRAISGETAQKAIDYLMRHLLPHAIAFYEDGLGQSEAHDIAKAVAGRILGYGKTEVTLLWLNKSAPKAYRNLPEQKRREVLVKLIELGWIVPVGTLDTLSKKPSRYLVNPAVHILYEKHKAAQAEKLEHGREIANRIMQGANGED